MALRSEEHWLSSRSPALHEYSKTVEDASLAYPTKGAVCLDLKLHSSWVR